MPTQLKHSGWTFKKRHASAQKGHIAVVDALAAKAARGEEGALEELCAEVCNGVLLRVRLRCNASEADTEDIAQEVLLKMCMGISRLNDPRTFRAWLNSIVANEVKMHWRQNAKVGRVLVLEDYLAELPEDNEDFLPQECCLREEESRLVMEIIETLPARQREVVILHYYDGMNVAEMAEIMGLAHQNVSQYLKLAREKLRKELRQMAEETNDRCVSALLLMPMGQLMQTALENVAGQMPMASEAWAAQAATQAVRTAGMPGTAATVLASKAAGALPLKLMAGVGVALAGVVLAVSIASTMPGPQGQLPPQDVAVQGSITFSGGNAQQSYVNPTGAVAQAQSGEGQMTVLRWQISTADGVTQLYSGEGTAPDEALAALQQSGQEGEYSLGFYMQDERGVGAWLTKSFFIQ